MTPASLVRGASYAWQNATSGDIAEACTLTEVGLTDHPGKDYQASPSHPELSSLIKSRDTNPLTLEAVWLCGARPHYSWSPGLQDRYVFIVRDLRFQLPTRIWFAHFSCVAAPVEQGTDVGGGSGSGGGQNLE